MWFDGPGEREETLHRVEAALPGADTEETIADGTGI
jgi:hypothetical protein